MSACDSCLCRSALLAALAGRIEHAAHGRRLPALLALDDERLLTALNVPHGARATLLGSVSPERTRDLAKTARLTSVCRHEDRFPRTLFELADHPAALFVAGDIELLERLRDDPAVAVVGSRRASAYGLEVARVLGRELTAAGVYVVSGMAFGVDAAAHEGALEIEGPTIAVLGGGADVAYPAAHRGLHARIVRHGLVVSELPPGFRPRPWCFPARNRIMAAISAMTVVVEAASASGSLITARLAAELGRDIGAVPGRVTSPGSAGTNALLADGACLVRGAGDVLDALHGPGTQARLPGLERTVERLDPSLRAVLEAVERGEATPEQIARDPLSVPATVVALAELELLGLIKADVDGSYLRAAGAE